MLSMTNAQFTPKKLTRKQAAFVKELVDNPKKSATRAALAVYGKEGKELSYATAGNIAHDNLKKPQIIMALDEYSALFESAIVGVVRDWKDSDNTRKREIATQNAQWGHDKVFGRSTVKLEQQTKIVRIAINLTGDGEEPPAHMLREAA